MNMPQIFKPNVNFGKYYILGSKMAKSNKNEKNEELITGYQKAECLWNVLPSLHKDINLWQMTSSYFGNSHWEGFGNGVLNT